MEHSAAVQEFWAAFLQSRAGDLPPDTTFHEAFMFGDGGELAAECAAAVLAGAKTATSGLVRGRQAAGYETPAPGSFSIVLDADEAPVCVIETLETHIRAFNEVDEQFACDYGEGERTLAWWRTALWNYYAAECAEHGWEPSPEMLLECERFRVVYRP